MTQFNYGQKVTTNYYENEGIVLTVAGINELVSPPEYWLQHPTGNRETFPESAIRAYVKPFDPQPGEYYTLGSGNKALVLARAKNSLGQDFIMYEYPETNHRSGTRSVGVAYGDLKTFKLAFPNLTDLNEKTW